MTATKPFQTQNFYELLEVTFGASQDEIRAAYQKSMDLYGEDSVAMYALDDASMVEEMRSRLVEAWKVLGDSELRQAYDDSLTAPQDRPRRSVSLVPQDAGDVETEKAIAAPSVESKFIEMEPPGESPPSPLAKDLGERAIVKQADASPSASARKDEPVEKPKPRVDLPPDADINGEVLRRVRESRGFTLQQIADRTRISSRHLQNVEADKYGDLPVPVYLRGILMNLARELGLDPLRVSKSYLALSTRPKS